MAATKLRGSNQLLAGSVQRANLDTTTAASAVIARVLAGPNIALTSTGVDAGTGDVTVDATAGNAAGLTAITTISGTTYTSGGVTLANQTLAAGAVWRVRAYGTITSANSATARNARFAVVWGGTLLTLFTGGVAVNVAGTAIPWIIETELSASSTSALWQTGFWFNTIGTMTAVAVKILMITPASLTGLPTGAQTIDFQFGFNTNVAGDSVAVHSVFIERIK